MAVDLDRDQVGDPDRGGDQDGDGQGGLQPQRLRAGQYGLAGEAAGEPVRQDEQLVDALLILELAQHGPVLLGHPASRSMAVLVSGND